MMIKKWRLFKGDHYHKGVICQDEHNLLSPKATKAFFSKNNYVKSIQFCDENKMYNDVVVETLEVKQGLSPSQSFFMSRVSDVSTIQWGDNIFFFKEVGKNLVLH